MGLTRLGVNGSVDAPLFHALASETEDRMLGWNIPVEYTGLVHDHWRGFEAPAMYWHVGLAIIYLGLIISSLTGNGLVAYAYFTTKSLRTPSNILVVNQVFLDLMMLVDIPWLVANSVAQYVLGGETGCDIYGLAGSLAGIGSAMNNAMIAFDRYRTIAFPIDGRLTAFQTIMLALLAWLWAVPFSVVPLLRLMGTRYVAEGFLTSCSFDYLTDSDETRYFMAIIFVWAYVIPILLIIGFYSQLFGKVREHSAMLAAQAKKMNMKSLQSNADADKTSAEIRIMRIAMSITVLFLISWTPYAVVALMGAFGDRSKLTPVSTMIPAIFAKVVSCIDPWIYAINHPRFRAEIEKVLPCLRAKKKPAAGDAKSAATEATGDGA